MSKLYLPWSSNGRNNERNQARNQFASTLDLHKQSSYEYQDPVQRQRSPSLPPIHHGEQQHSMKDEHHMKDFIDRNVSTKRFSFYDEDGEGDTSGYGSETVNLRKNSNNEVTNPVLAWQQNQGTSRAKITSEPWSNRSPRSNSTEEGRLKWGDRGVATGRLWEPTAPDDRLPQMLNQNKGTPSWVERGLNMIENTSEVLVIDQKSSTNSGFECDSSCNGSDEGRTFLRGQNVPLSPGLKAQRENKRMKALELQSAILSQLEDREKQRQEERERKLKEEKLEELRILRQQEEDLERMEQEKRKLQEKQLNEQRKLETLKKALEDAERKAKLEKEMRFSILKQNLNSKEKEFDIVNEKQSISKENVDLEESNKYDEKSSPIKSNRTYKANSAQSGNDKEFVSDQTTESNSPRYFSAPSNVNLFIHSVPPLSLVDNNYRIVPIGINPNGELGTTQQNCVQLAVLVPPNLNNNVYNIPPNLINKFTETENNESNKIITPRQYRSARYQDAHTQTDHLSLSMIERCLELREEECNVKDYSKIDENAPQELRSTVKKDRRYRSEERYKKDIENRPKWGVNRPVAQYKKQSEKDPFYAQKRKLRYKLRPQNKYMSQSSEDSRSPSPPVRSGNGNEHIGKTRNTLSQSYWQNKRCSEESLKFNSIIDNNAVEQNLSQWHGVENGEVKKAPVSNNLSPNKRLTLSQKFINDKYGNRKLWVDDTSIVQNNKSCQIEDDNRKKNLDLINAAKKAYVESNNDEYEKLIPPMC